MRISTWPGLGIGLLTAEILFVLVSLTLGAY